jgi:multiple antibiotic resistance protein
MDASFTSRTLADVLIGFSTLFSIINPFGMAFLFVHRTKLLSAADRNSLARRIATYSFVLILASTFAGAPILHFFGIGIPALRVAGGFVVALAGYGMLTEPDWRDGDSARAVTPGTVDGMAFFPLTLPLTIGPGTVAACIALGAEPKARLEDHVSSAVAGVLVAASIAVSIFLFYRSSARIAALFGAEGTRIVTRLTAFLLLCIGVQLMMTGTAAWLSPLQVMTSS